MDSFVADLTDEQSRRLFAEYYDGCYDHLMRHAVVGLSSEEERNALNEYLGRCIDQNAGDQEMRDLLTPIVHDRDFDALLGALRSDQRLAEPLYRMVNGR